MNTVKNTTKHTALLAALSFFSLSGKQPILHDPVELLFKSVESIHHDFDTMSVFDDDTFERSLLTVEYPEISIDHDRINIIASITLPGVDHNNLSFKHNAEKKQIKSTIPYAQGTARIKITDSAIIIKTKAKEETNIQKENQTVTRYVQNKSHASEPFPSRIDLSKASVFYEDDTLVITLPKKEETQLKSKPLGRVVIPIQRK